MKTTLFILLLTFFLNCSDNSPQKKNPPSLRDVDVAQSFIPEFNGRTAFDYVKGQVKFGPRNPGSIAHERCLDYLEFEMRKYANAVNLQTFTHAGYDGKPLKMTNVISSFNLQASTRILLVAHWDSRPWADQDTDPNNQQHPIIGANDGASGVAILMEIARNLKIHPPKVGVDILFVDGEDYGKEGDSHNYLLGSKYFATHLPQGFSPIFGVVVDMVGDKELQIQKEPTSLKYAPDIVELIWSTAKQLNIYQFSESLQNSVMDDHVPLNNAGIKTIVLIDFDYPDESNRFWHTMDDTVDKCSSESLEAVGRVLTHVIYTFTP